MAQQSRPTTGLSRPLIWAVLLHAVLILLLTVGITWWNDEPVRPAGQAIEAEVIDPAALDAAREQIDAAERARQAKAAEEEQRIEALQRQREQEQKRTQAAAEQRQQAEREREAAQQAKQQAQAAAQKAAAEKTVAEKAVAVAKQQAQAAAQAAAQKRQQEQAAKAATEQAAAAKSAAEKAVADKAAADKAAAQQAAAAKAAADQAASAKAAADKAAAAQAASGEAERANQISGFVAAIQRQVQARWRKPLNWPPQLQCNVRVKLLPSGEVISAQAVDCGGDPAFVDSVEQAVLAASPLQVPTDIRLFNEHFRNFIFEFKADAG